MINLRNLVTMRSNSDIEVKQRFLEEYMHTRMRTRAHTHTHTHSLTHSRQGRGSDGSFTQEQLNKKGFPGNGKWAWVNGTSRQVFYRKNGILIIKRNLRLNGEEEDEAL